MAVIILCYNDIVLIYIIIKSIYNMGSYNTDNSSKYIIIAIKIVMISSGMGPFLMILFLLQSMISVRTSSDDINLAMGHLSSSVNPLIDLPSEFNPKKEEIFFQRLIILLIPTNPIGVGGVNNQGTGG